MRNQRPFSACLLPLFLLCLCPPVPMNLLWFMVQRWVGGGRSPAVVLRMTGPIGTGGVGGGFPSYVGSDNAARSSSYAATR